MHRRQVHAEDWPRVWHGAQRVSSSLAIDMDIAYGERLIPFSLISLLEGKLTSYIDQIIKHLPDVLKN